MYQDGQTATNPTTGEKVVLQGGQWVPMGGARPAQRAPGVIYGRPKPVDPIAERRLDLAEEANTRAATAAERSASVAERQIGNEAFNQASKIRDDYNQDQSVKAFQRVLPKYVAALKQADGTAAGDLALTYAYATLMDPQSAVREGEQAMQAGGDTLYGRTVARVMKEMGNGGTFRPEYRRDLLKQMRKAGAELRVTYDTQRQRYADIAQRAGLNPEDVVGRDPARDYGDQEAEFWAKQGDAGAKELLSDTRFDAAVTPPSKAGPDEAVVFNDEARPVTAARYKPEQEAQIAQAIRDGDLGQVLALHERFSGNKPTDATIASTRAAIEAVKKDPRTKIGVSYGSADAAAQSAADKEKFGDFLAPAMEQRKDSVVDPIIRGVADIVPFSDEIAAAGNTLLGGGTYADNIRKERAIDEADARVNPILRGAGQVAGAAVPIGRILGFGKSAGVARSAASYGKEGAAMGGLYAAGKADPNPDASLGDSMAARAAQAPVGAAIGGGLAYGLGAVVNRMANRPPPAGPNGGARGAADAAFGDASPLSAVQRASMASAANDLGVEVTRGDVGGTVSRMARGVLEKTFGAAPIAKQAMRTVGQAGDARDRIAESIGSVADEVGAGQAAQRGARSFLDRSKRVGEKLFNRIPVPRSRESQVDQTRTALQEITQGLDSNPELSKLWAENPRLQATLDALTPEMTPAERLTRARSSLTAAQDRYKASVGLPSDNRASLRKGVEDARESLRSAEALVSAKQASVTTGARGQGQLSWGDMKRFRSIIGEAIDRPTVSSDDAGKAALRKLYGALSSDMEATARAEGGIALDAFRRANRYWRGREGRREGIITDILGQNFDQSPEAAFSRINKWAQRQGGDFASVARTLRSVPNEEANTIRASLIAQMGHPTPGQQNAAGTLFSPDVYATQWNKLSVRAKAFLFPEKSHREALDKLALVTTGLKRAGAEYRNFSNTTLGTNAVAFLTGMQVAPITTLATAAGTYGAGRIMASPVGAQWAARMALTPPQKLAPLVNSLSVVARRDPAIAQDVLGLQQRLTEAFAQAPLRAAAGEKEKQ